MGGSGDLSQYRRLAELEATDRHQTQRIDRHEAALEQISQKLHSIDERLARFEIRMQERDRVYRVIAAVIGAVCATIVWVLDLWHRVSSWFFVSGRGQ